ncbi:arylsulfatase B-like [Ptychodera flava]|uniref:arylsulfatase B-like n=1 Tax=Ptychodera flava TaxID=63121 RepID=UPI00396A1F0C
MRTSMLCGPVLLLAAFAAVGNSAAYPGKAQKPNIVFVVADDLGWNDIGYNNDDIFSPTLDSLAREGVILNQSYVQEVCSPTRGALMTGYYPYRLGLQHKSFHSVYPSGLPLNYTLLPQKLKEHGYSTYIVGKWHLGFCNYNYTPNARGFDRFYGYYNADEGYYNHSVGGYLDLREDLTPDWSKNGTYSTDIFTNKAIHYLATHNKSKPFYLYLPYQSVHGPIAVPKKYYDMYPFIHDQSRRIKSGMVTAMDDTVKALIQALQDFGYWDNTLFIFTTDNGGPSKPQNGGNNWPLRGTKATLWEGGTRGVAFIYGSILQKTGYVNNEMIHVVDWYPTLLELVGGKPDSDMDGINVWNTLVKGDPSPRKEFVYNIDEVEPSGAAIRMGDYKLILGYAGAHGGWIPPPSVNGLWQEIVPMDDYEVQPGVCADPTNSTYLFNLKDDPTEHFNLADKMPEKVQEMTARLEELKKKLVPAIQVPKEPKKADPRKFGGVWSPGWC